MNIRYDFGRNWNEYSDCLDEKRIDIAVKDLEKLTGNISGKTFLDIGSGSGIHSIAAINLGASEVISIDMDNICVETTQRNLEKYCSGQNWTVRQGNILDTNRLSEKQFDIVYSWGVLHHTGNIYRAINNAIKYVKPGGKFIIALYRKTHLCKFWQIEKLIYSKYETIRPLIKKIYVSSLFLAYRIRGRNPDDIIKNYYKTRGMSFFHDVDDWLGGYPYQSITHDELIKFLGDDFFLKNSFNAIGKKPLGLFGSGCGEWVFEKKPIE